MDTKQTPTRKQILRELAKLEHDPEQAMAWLEDFTHRGHYPIEETAEAYLRLAVTGCDPRDGTLQALANTAHALRVSLLRIVHPISHSLSRGRLSKEDLVQLVESGLPIQAIERACNVDRKTLHEELARGQGSAAQVRALIQIMAEEIHTRRG